MAQWTSSQSQSEGTLQTGPSAAQQHEWDMPVIAADKARLMVIVGMKGTRLLAVITPHIAEKKKRRLESIPKLLLVSTSLHLPLKPPECG